MAYFVDDECEKYDRQQQNPVMKLPIILLLLLPITNVLAKESTCYGTTAKGRLASGVELPAEGKNFVSYSRLAKMLGRTYVHSKVRKIILESYRALALEQPGKKYKYAETGFEHGGSFKPHKTHQNGLSVDFMVPVINAQDKSVYFPTNPLNKFGYAVEFDKKGKYKNYQIDFTAMAAHIVALHKSALKHHADIWRVIFAPGLQKYLLQTKYGNYIKKNIKLSKKPSWVRHDEHYHVDFLIKCKPL